MCYLDFSIPYTECRLTCEMFSVISLAYSVFTVAVRSNLFHPTTIPFNDARVALIAT
ncbi:hypothetical protein CCP3SC1_120006 [Gammaproteobacteria bacterium]